MFWDARMMSEATALPRTRWTVSCDLCGGVGVFSHGSSLCITTEKCWRCGGTGRIEIPIIKLDNVTGGEL